MNDANLLLDMYHWLVPEGKITIVRGTICNYAASVTDRQGREHWGEGDSMDGAIDTALEFWKRYKDEMPAMTRFSTTSPYEEPKKEYVYAATTPEGPVAYFSTLPLCKRWIAQQGDYAPRYGIRTISLDPEEPGGEGDDQPED